MLFRFFSKSISTFCDCIVCFWRQQSLRDSNAKGIIMQDCSKCFWNGRRNILKSCSYNSRTSSFSEMTFSLIIFTCSFDSFNVALVKKIKMKVMANYYLVESIIKIASQKFDKLCCESPLFLQGYKKTPSVIKRLKLILYALLLRYLTMHLYWRSKVLHIF